MTHKVLVDVLVATTGLGIVVWIVSVVARRSSAALRHTLWRIALAGFWLVPVVLVTANVLDLDAYAVRVPILPTAEFTQSTEAIGPQGSGSLATGVSSSAAATSRETRPQQVLTAERIDVVKWLLLLWMAGAAFGGACFVRNMYSVRRLLSQSSPADDPVLTARASHWAAKIGLEKVPALAESETVVVPTVAGWRAPMILLPRGFSVSDAGSDAIIVHELAHVHRGDVATVWLARLTQALWWWHPLVWLIAHKLRSSAEEACDNWAIALTERRKAYAGVLVHWAEVGASASNLACAYQGKALVRRVKRILTERRIPMLQLSGRMKAVLAVCALCAIVGTGALRTQSAETALPTPVELWPMPEDNGWDDLLAAIEMVRRPTPPPSDRPSPPPFPGQPRPYGPGYRDLLLPGWKDELSEEELRKAFRPLEPALTRLDVALSKPFVITYPESSPWEEGASRPGEELGYVRQFAIVLAAKARLHQLNSDHEQARGAFEKALALANRLSQGGLLIHRRMGSAMRAIALHYMQSWIANRPPVATLEGTADFLEQLAEQQVPRWKIVATEAWLRRQRLETWYAGAVSEEDLDWWAKIYPELRERPIVGKAAALEMWRQHYQQLVQIAKLPLWEAVGAQLPEPDGAQFEPFLDPPKSFRRWLEIDAMAETELRGTRIMVALELYRYDQPHEGWYPARLRDLVPHYLTELPPDPFSGQDFLYQRAGRFTYKLYGVGQNRTDDGGKQELNVWGGDTDWVIHEIK